MAAPLFPVNAHRFDPYRTFKFQVVIDGRVVAGLSKMSALKKSTEVVSWRFAGDPSHQRKLPGGTNYEAISLEAGLTHDKQFLELANRVNNIEGDAGMSLKNFRSNLVINVINLQGAVAMSFKVYRAWVSEFQALPDFDANSMNAVGIQTVKFEHEGWELDAAVSEPAEV
ncbi:phage tail protein [Mesorhizobium sp. M1233]|uniref:phage tail protein n=1 Tax=unclassified Mesorhizobium TaxID=325217 RepID=UPI0033368128